VPSLAVTSVLTAALVLAAGSGCQTTSGTASSTTSSSSGRAGHAGTASAVVCTGEVCKVEVSGDPTNSRISVMSRALRIRSIDDGSVDLVVEGTEQRISVGSTEIVSGLEIRVVEAREGRTKLEIRHDR